MISEKKERALGSSGSSNTGGEKNGERKRGLWDVSSQVPGRYTESIGCDEDVYSLFMQNKEKSHRLLADKHLFTHDKQMFMNTRSCLNVSAHLLIPNHFC